VPENKSDVLQGTLDLMVLKTLESMGPLHGYGVARRVEQVSGNSLRLNQGTIYPALLRLKQRGWLATDSPRTLVLSDHEGRSAWSGLCAFGVTPKVSRLFLGGRYGFSFVD